MDSSSDRKLLYRRKRQTNEYIENYGNQAFHWASGLLWVLQARQERLDDTQERDRWSVYWKIVAYTDILAEQSQQDTFGKSETPESWRCSFSLSLRSRDWWATHRCRETKSSRAFWGVFSMQIFNRMSELDHDCKGNLLHSVYQFVRKTHPRHTQSIVPPNIYTLSGLSD